MTLGLIPYDNSVIPLKVVSATGYTSYLFAILSRERPSLLIPA